ncbi:MAG: glycosyltransferase [Pseudomonadota bacterium]
MSASAKDRRVEAEAGGIDPARISIVIPAYATCPHLPALLDALEGATVHPREIIVSHSGPDDPTAALGVSHPGVRVLHATERLLGGGARNRGVAAASGDWLGFIDADVRPAPDWLARIAAAANEGRFVVGAIGTASSGGYWGMCNWLSEFSEQAPWHRARRQQGGASANMLVSAADFLAAGGFPEDHQPGEDTILFGRVAAAGREQWFAPEACVFHHNNSGFRAFLRHQYRLGWNSALLRQRIDTTGSIATRIWPLALGFWAIRFARVAWRGLTGGPPWWARTALYAPGLAIGALTWNIGFLRRLWQTQPEQRPQTAGLRK